MYKSIFFLIFISISNLSAQNENKWMLDSKESVIEYNAKHLLHAWSGINNDVKGVFLEDSKSKIAISANIADFDSGISNRDSNTIRVLNALNFPSVKFFSNEILISSDTIELNGELDFHGKKINKIVKASYIKGIDNLTIEGDFSIVLTDFEIKLPSLMLVKMDDLAKINFKLIFKKSN
ncbi:YceI family protein [Flavobacteriaceae bacterium]|nr:YceI family protein [Flavobacteriaceae bacterium]MDB4144523.1 YceI family protein [Flavobacteriaceae bacterium]